MKKIRITLLSIFGQFIELFFLILKWIHLECFTDQANDIDQINDAIEKGREH